MQDRFETYTHLKPGLREKTSRDRARDIQTAEMLQRFKTTLNA